MRCVVFMACLWAQAALADTAAYKFTWVGNGGYELRGIMAFDAALLSVSRVYETDVSCFEITGFKDEVQVGRWALGMLTPETTWTTPGFGFNIGSAAQDICVDGDLKFDSQVAPPRPFPAMPELAPKFSQDACRPEVLLGMR